MFDEMMKSMRNKRLSPQQESFPFSEVMLYGAGGRGRAAARFFKSRGIRVVRFFDGNPELHGALIDGVECLPPSEVGRFSGVPLVVASHMYMDISQELLKQGITDFYHNFHIYGQFYEPDLLETHGQRIARICESLADEASRRAYLSVVKSVITGDDGFLELSPYIRYHHPATLPAPGDVIVDGGAYDGATALEFLDMCGGKCSVYAFEPFPESFSRMGAMIGAKGLGGVVMPVRKALWSSAGVKYFDTCYETAEAFCIGESGQIRVETVNLDAYLPPEAKVDLIKLDVEGSELEALKGCAGTIERWRPKLHVCLYHKLEDLWTIPEYLLSLDLGYEFYLGQSNTVMQDTVLYASPRRGS